MVSFPCVYLELSWWLVLSWLYLLQTSHFCLGVFHSGVQNLSERRGWQHDLASMTEGAYAEITNPTDGLISLCLTWVELVHVLAVVVADVACLCRRFPPQCSECVRKERMTTCSLGTKTSQRRHPFVPYYLQAIFYADLFWRFFDTNKVLNSIIQSFQRSLMTPMCFITLQETTVTYVPPCKIGKIIIFKSVSKR